MTRLGICVMCKRDDAEYGPANPSTSVCDSCDSMVGALSPFAGEAGAVELNGHTIQIVDIPAGEDQPPRK